MAAAAQELQLSGDPRLHLSPKKRIVSVNKDNMNLMLGVCGPDKPDIRACLKLLKNHHEIAKLATSYSAKLTGDRRRGLVHGVPGKRAMIAYPTWYPVPGYHGKQLGVEGGTIQGRFSCKDPAAQTFPPAVKKALCSRFHAGSLSSYDLSQIELRVAALLSADPTMLGEYQKGVDRHIQTAQLIFEKSAVTLDERQLGKTLNFLMLYRGGPAKFGETVMRDMGLSLTHDFCRNAINLFDERYFVFRQWQDRLIAYVREKGYLELPTGWSRSFGTGTSVNTYINEICNFPIQTTAAQLMQSAQYAIIREILDNRLRARIELQTHDSLHVDCPVEEQAQVDQIVDRYLKRPPLMLDLERVLRRTVPIEYAKTIIEEANPADVGKPHTSNLQDSPEPDGAGGQPGEVPDSVSQERQDPGPVRVGPVGAAAGRDRETAS
jgi:DNA polymerase-1